MDKYTILFVVSAASILVMPLSERTGWEHSSFTGSGFGFSKSELPKIEETRSVWTR